MQTTSQPSPIAWLLHRDTKRLEENVGAVDIQLSAGS
jgi:hypothetical protein